MYAAVGDHIHVNARRVGGAVRDGTIIEVRGDGGSPPYLILWAGSHSATLAYPGPDAQVSGSLHDAEGTGRPPTQG
jgi:hypothetical protein